MRHVNRPCCCLVKKGTARTTQQNNTHDLLLHCILPHTSCGGITSGYDELLEKAKDDRLDARCLEVLHILEQGMHNIAQQVVRRELE
jgi:hypothetical protein